jgi:hypothetical protein
MILMILFGLVPLRKKLSMSKFKVDWSGGYPNLCSGVWTISYDGNDFILPDDKMKEPMGTAKEYDSWCFSDNWSEEWDSTYFGEEAGDWIMSNISWITPNFQRLNIPETLETYGLLYEEIKVYDWQLGSCGGCI